MIVAGVGDPTNWRHFRGVGAIGVGNCYVSLDKKFFVQKENFLFHPLKTHFLCVLSIGKLPRGLGLMEIPTNFIN